MESGVLTVAEKSRSSIDLWRGVFSAEAALRIVRRYQKQHGEDADTLDVEGTLQRHLAVLETRRDALARADARPGGFMKLILLLRGLVRFPSR